MIFTLLVGGCFSERSYPLRHDRLVRLSPPAGSDQAAAPAAVSTRQWARHAAETLSQRSHRTAGTLSDARLLSHRDRPVAVAERFDVDCLETDSLLSNLRGLSETAQVIPVEEPLEKFADWPGFRRIEIPIGRADEPNFTTLSAVIAAPTSRAIDGSYIVLAHGLFGRQYGADQRNYAEALRAFGHHVVGIEMRGHGWTQRLHPDTPMTFGLDEATDLLAVDRYLRSYLGARRVGFVGFSLTSHQALMAAWYDSADPRRSEGDLPVLEGIESIATGGDPPAYDAGMVLYSPALPLVSYCDSLERPWAFLASPVRASFQQRAATRLRELGQPPQPSLWAYARYELSRSHWMQRYDSLRDLSDDTIQLMDFTGPHWRRLESIRVPVLAVQAVDDPVVGTAQAAVDVFSMTRNPNVALLLLPRGGHAGFSAGDSGCNYSLLREFFDPATAPRAVTAGR